MGWLAQLVGTILVILAIVDLFLTVLYPRGDQGIVSVRLGRILWRFFRICGNIRPTNRNRILSFMGPTVLVATIAMWVILLILGFALIFFPALGREIQFSGQPTPTDFWTAIYYSGYSLATLGTGEILPLTAQYRILMILEAILGFVVLTLTLTYLESVYSQLIQRNVFALSLHHRTGRTGDAAEMLARFGIGGDFDSSTKRDLSDIAQNALNVLESHHSYSALPFFRLEETYYSLARVIFLVLDTVTLIRTALDDEEYHALVHCASVVELEESGIQLLIELSNTFLPGKPSRIQTRSQQLWHSSYSEILRDRYYHALDRLDREGIKTVRDRQAGAEHYITMRQQWSPRVAALAFYLDYDWAEVAPADQIRAYELRQDPKILQAP